MIRWALLLALSVSLYACSTKQTNSRILSKEEMGKVTWDLMLIDDYISNSVRDSLIDINKERLSLYLKVFQLHKITKEDYTASLKYYSARPDVMKVIFDSLAAKGRRQGPAVKM